jgi:hypothetical protein
MKRLALLLVGLMVAGCCPLRLQRGIPEGMHPVGSAEAPQKARMTSPEQLKPPTISPPMGHMH